MDIDVFVFRSNGFYGVGLTTKAAVEAAVDDGMQRKHIKSGMMHLMPKGITSVEVDEMGSIRWSDGIGKAVALVYDNESKRFVTPLTTIEQKIAPVVNPA